MCSRGMAYSTLCSNLFMATSTQPLLTPTDSVRNQILASEAVDAVKRALRIFPTVDTVRDCIKILGL